MKISHDIRDEVNAGMAQKAAEFRESGGEIYMAEIARTLIGGDSAGAISMWHPHFISSGIDARATLAPALCDEATYSCDRHGMLMTQAGGRTCSLGAGRIHSVRQI